MQLADTKKHLLGLREFLASVNKRLEQMNQMVMGPTPPAISSANTGAKLKDCFIEEYGSIMSDVDQETVIIEAALSRLESFIMSNGEVALPTHVRSY